MEVIETAKERIDLIIPKEFRIGLIGSTSFYSPLSAPLCVELGKLLSLRKYVLLTGGMTGVQETVAESMLSHSSDSKVFHLLPAGSVCCPNGITLVAGRNMEERRVILAQSCSLLVAIEGGPGTVDEIEIALSAQNTIVPVFCTGGASSGMFGTPTSIFSKPANHLVSIEDWDLVTSASPNPSPELLVAAIIRIIDSLIT